MKAVLQRVQEASVSINGDIVSHISKGFLILLGIEAQDGEEQARILANKTASLRVFEDENGKLNLSALETGGSVLVVSNFTLCADCKKENALLLPKRRRRRKLRICMRPFAGI